MKIIFENNGGVGILNPAPKKLASMTGTDEEKMIAIANKDLPIGTKYEIVADEDVPSDRSKRDLWRYEAGENERTSEDV